MTLPPYRDARRVFWIVDNCSVHRGQTAVQRLRENILGSLTQVQLVHAPTHASWLNQVEIYFSIVQRTSALAKTDLSLLARNDPVGLI
jgi:hypothetical protein